MQGARGRQERMRFLGGKSRLMRGVRAEHGRLNKLGLLSGAAMALAFPSGALAQTPFELPTPSPNSAARVERNDAPGPPAQTPPPQADDGLGQHGFYMEANSLTRDDK